MIHLRQISIEERSQKSESFPFNVPLIRNLSKLEFQSPVTVFIGENGSGKSTLLESIAIAAGLTTIGRDSENCQPTGNGIQSLSDNLKMVWNKRIHRGFFLRAEDFFRFIHGLQQLRDSLKTELDRVDRAYQFRSDFAKSLAKMPAASSIDALEKRYGPEPGAKSHGERYLALFQARFVPGGLYILDEPEAALSPISQMGLISMIKEMVNQQAQFIIATHSPILMALPDALIWNFDCLRTETIDYDDVEHVQLYRSFLSDPQAFLRYL